MNRIKWFSHDNDASEDEWMHELIREFGPAGYGRYWILIENFDRHRKGEEWATSWAFIREKLRTRSGEVRKLLDFFQGSGKVLSEEVGEKLIISIPKFIEKQAKLRANFYSTLRESTPDLAIDKTRLEDIKNNKDLAAKRRKPAKPKKKKEIKRGGFHEFMDRFLKHYFDAPIGVDSDNARAEMKALYSRYGRAGRDVLALAGSDINLAIKGVDCLGRYFDKKELSWTLDTIAKRFAEWKSNPGEFKDENNRQGY